MPAKGGPSGGALGQRPVLTCGGAWPVASVAWWFRIEGRSSSANRSCSDVCPSPQSPSSVLSSWSRPPLGPSSPASGPWPQPGPDAEGQECRLRSSAGVGLPVWCPGRSVGKMRVAKRGRPVGGVRPSPAHSVRRAPRRSARRLPHRGCGPRRFGRATCAAPSAARIRTSPSARSPVPAAWPPASPCTPGPARCAGGHVPGRACRPVPTEYRGGSRSLSCSHHCPQAASG